MLSRIFRRSFATKNRILFNRSANAENSNDYQIDTRSEQNSDVSNNENSLRELLEEATSFVDTKPQEDEEKWATLPYAEGTVMTRHDRYELDVERPRIDPKDTSLIIFPGADGYFVGMAKPLERVPAARDLFSYASEIVGYDLMKFCNNGPENRLAEMHRSDVAVMVTSLGFLELLREERPNAVLDCVGTAGFSLGEITALVFAGALDFGEAVQLVQVRAEAIRVANEQTKGMMASIIYGPDSKVKEACQKAKGWCVKHDIANAECWISGYLYPKYKYISGNEEAIKYIKENMEKFRLRGIRPVGRTPACHSKLMEPTIEPIKQALEHMQIEDPLIRVYSNVNSKHYWTAEHIRKQLPLQLVKPLHWEQTMSRLYTRKHGSHFPRTIFCGPGFFLKKYLRYMNYRAGKSAIHFGSCPSKPGKTVRDET